MDIPFLKELLFPFVDRDCWLYRKPSFESEPFITLKCVHLFWIPAAERFALCPLGVLVGGTRSRHFAGISLEPNKRPENAARTPSRLHAVLGRVGLLRI